MKYLLCYVELKDHHYTVYDKEFDNFSSAIKCYTLMCASCGHVTLSNLEKECIIRQFAHESSYSYEGSTSSAICIY